MSDRSKFAIPQAVECFLSEYASTTKDDTDRLNAKRLLDAPCSRQAFCSISNTLKKAARCRYDLDYQLRFVADSAMIAGGISYRNIWDGASDLRHLLKVAADAARTLSDAFENISMRQRETELQNDDPEKLLNTEWFPLSLHDFASLAEAADVASTLLDAFENISMRQRETELQNEDLEKLLNTKWFTVSLHDFASLAKAARSLHDFASLAEAASGNKFESPNPEFSIALKKRQFNELAPYVHNVDSHIAEFVRIGDLPADFRLSHVEMAAFACAVLGEDNISAFSQSANGKDVRAERVRKVRKTRNEK